MSKLKYLDNINKQITDSMFYVDQRYMKSLSPILSDWFKKMKPLPGFSRIFQDYNKRYFTINLVELSLYYSIKKNYSLDEITYIPFQVKSINYKGKSLKSKINRIMPSPIKVQNGKKLSDSLYIQEKDIQYQLLNQILLTSNGQITSNPFATNKQVKAYQQDHIIEAPKQNKENYEQPEKMARIDQKIENQSIKEPIIEQNVPEVHIQHKCETELIDKYDDVQDDQEFLEIQKTQLKNIVPQELKYQPDEPQYIPQVINSQKQLFIEAPFEEQKVVDNTDQKDEEIIRFGEKQEPQQRNSTTKEIMIQPIRLDSTRKQTKGQEQIKLQGIEKQTTNIWQEYDLNGNPKQIPSIKQNCFIQPYFLKQNEELDQPDFLIRFDEMDSSR